jgi:hypothetical protein
MKAYNSPVRMAGGPFRTKLINPARLEIELTTKRTTN